MPLRIVLFLFALALFVGGGSLVYQSNQMAPWTDEAKANAVQMWDLPDESAPPQEIAAFNKHWRRAISRLSTDKWTYHDAGTTLIAFSTCLIASLLLLKIRTTNDVAALATPRRAWKIYGLALLGWGVYWVSFALAMVEGFDRFRFPPLPGSELTMLYVIAAIAAVGAVALSVVSFFILRKSQLPAPLWIWRRDMPGHDWFYTIGAGLTLLIGMEVLRETYCYGHWLAVPGVFLCVYATLAMRAAGIAKNV
jgi:hypothetical protein